MAMIMANVETPRPTDEQMVTIEAAAAGANVLCTARAGTGKTTTMVAAGKATAGQGRRTLTLAFNRKAVEELRLRGVCNAFTIDALTMNAAKAAGYRFGDNRPYWEILGRLSRTVGAVHRGIVARCVDVIRDHGFVPAALATDKMAPGMMRPRSTTAW